MRVSKLWLHNFRNFADAELHLAAGAHLFVGANGQGKTNLVEAIGYLATLTSHRVSSDAMLVRQGCERGVVRAELAHGSRNLLIEVEIAKSGSNRAQVNGRAVRARELTRYFNTVLFAPEDLALVRGEPSTRRAFLDSLLATRTPRLAQVIADYDRVLKQRNSLLRSARSLGKHAPDLGTLDIWDERLIDLGTEIIAERLQLVARLVPFLESGYARLVDADHGAGISMRMSALDEAAGDVSGESSNVESGNPIPAAGDIEFSEIRAQFSARIQDYRSRELERGLSLVGPHRDDAVFWLNGLPARTTASHGESWSFALALKLASAELVRAESMAGDPVLILDDVFAELDERRRSRLASAIGTFEQTLITAAVFGDVPEHMRTHVTRIRAGEILEGGE